MNSQFIDYDLMPEFGYDWSFAPIMPAETEYRQTHAAEQRIWLECWQPRIEH